MAAEKQPPKNIIKVGGGGISQGHWEKKETFQDYARPPKRERVGLFGKERHLRREFGCRNNGKKRDKVSKRTTQQKKTEGEKNIGRFYSHL